MLAVKSMDVRGHFKEWCDKVFSGETLIISRPKNEKELEEEEDVIAQMIREMGEERTADKHLPPKLSH